MTAGSPEHCAAVDAAVAWLAVPPAEREGQRIIPMLRKEFPDLPLAMILDVIVAAGSQRLEERGAA